jgi:hypothetical protein
MISTLLYAFILLCIVGLILWGIGQIPGLPPVVKTVVYVVVGVLVLLWLAGHIQGTNFNFR